MPIVGWIDARDDRRHREKALLALSAATNGSESSRVRVVGSGGFVMRGSSGSREDVQLAVRGAATQETLIAAVEGRLTNRDRLAYRLGSRGTEASDADLVLAAYQAWGPWLVDRIEGVFALAIWDGRRDRLLLVADPLGIKTWYFRADSHGGVLAATSLRVLAAHPDVPASVGADGLNELLFSLHTPSHGVLRGVSQVSAGHLAQVTSDRVSVHPYRQWHSDPYRHNADASAAHVRRRLADATLALRERPPGAVLLSGGIGAAVAAALATHGLDPGGRMPTAYTLTLFKPWSRPLGGTRSVNAAAATAAHLHLPHTTVSTDVRGVLAAAADTRSVLDLPGDPAADALLLVLLRRIAADSSTAVSGEGAAGVFGSYPWLRHYDVMAASTFPWQERGLTPDFLLSAEGRQSLRPQHYRVQRYAEANDAILHLASALR